MSKLQKPVFNFLRFFNKLVRELRTYADDHPTVQLDLERLTAALGQAYQGKDTFSLGRDQDNLAVQDEIVDDKSEVVAAFLGYLKTTRVAKFVLRPGMPQEEILKLIRLVGMKAEDVLREKRIKPELLQPFRVIKVIEARFVLVTDDQEVISKGILEDASGEGEGGGAGALPSAPAAIPTGPEIDPATDPAGALDQAFERVLTDARGGSGGTGAGATAGDVVAFFRRINPHVGGLDEGVARAKLHHFLNQLLARTIRPEGGLSAALEVLRKAIEGIPDECQQLLFGAYLQHFENKDLLGVLRNCDPALHAGLLHAEIESGRRPTEELRGDCETLAPTPEAFLALMSSVAAEVAKPGGAAEEVDARMARLFALFPAVRPHATVRRKVLVVDADEMSVARYMHDVVEFGYEVVTESKGRDALEVWRARGPFDCVIMDLELPGVDGLEVLKALRAVESAPPVLVTTDNTALRSAPEVATHPHLRFLVKPVEPTDVMVALMDLCPQEEVSAEERSAGEERDRERMYDVLRMCFVPRELPALTDFDLAAIQQIATETSGDYCDVIPLPRGRCGFVVAEVAGPGAPPPMLLALVRTLVRSLAPQRVSPKALLKDVNRLLAKDLRGGALVRIIYGALDSAGRVMIVANAGHAPPAFRGRKTGSAVILESSGAAIGRYDADRFDAELKELMIKFEPNDRLLFCSDGVTGMKSPDGEPFGAGRLVGAVNDHPQADAAGLLDGVVKAVEQHRGAAAPSDNLTILVCRSSQVAPPAAGRDTGKIRAPQAVEEIPVAPARPAAGPTTRRLAAKPPTGPKGPGGPLPYKD